MLPEVPTQSNCSDTLVPLGEVTQQRPRAVRATVIDEDELERLDGGLQRSDEPFMENGKTLRTPVDRDDDGELDHARAVKLTRHKVRPRLCEDSKR